MIYSGIEGEVAISGYSKFSADRWPIHIKHSTFPWKNLTSLSRERLPLECFQSSWHIIFYCDISYGICSVFLWLKIEEVLVSIKERFSCHKDDGSAYNDQADVVRWNICRPHWATIGRKTVLLLFSSFFYSHMWHFRACFLSDWGGHMAEVLPRRGG